MQYEVVLSGGKDMCAWHTLAFTVGKMLADPRQDPPPPNIWHQEIPTPRQEFWSVGEDSHIDLRSAFANQSITGGPCRCDYYYITSVKLIANVKINSKFNPLAEIGKTNKQLVFTPPPCILNIYFMALNNHTRVPVVFRSPLPVSRACPKTS